MSLLTHVWLWRAAYFAQSVPEMSDRGPVLKVAVAVFTARAQSCLQGINVSVICCDSAAREEVEKVGPALDGSTG